MSTMSCGRVGRTLVLVGALAVMGAGGCVSLEKYDQLDMDHRTLQAEKTHLESELYDARHALDTVRNQLTARERELSTREQQVAALQAENDGLEAAFTSCQATLEKLAGAGVPDNILVVEPRLPPELDSALKSFAAKYPEAVVFDDKAGIVKWVSDLLFLTGSDVVREQMSEPLRSFAEVMASPAAADFEVVVAGHTDDRPIVKEATRQQHPTNWHLSVHRAVSVGRQLTGFGYPATKVGVAGFGEYRPLMDNSTEENRQRNRRVEIYVVPRGFLSKPARS